MMQRNVMVDVIGWIGVVILLAAYALVSTRRVEGNSALYQLLNLVGSALLIFNSVYYGAYPSVGVNLAWIFIALYTLARRRAASGS